MSKEEYKYNSWKQETIINLDNPDPSKVLTVENVRTVAPYINIPSALAVGPIRGDGYGGIATTNAKGDIIIVFPNKNTASGSIFDAANPSSTNSITFTNSQGYASGVVKLPDLNKNGFDEIGFIYYCSQDEEDALLVIDGNNLPSIVSLDDLSLLPNNVNYFMIHSDNIDYYSFSSANSFFGNPNTNDILVTYTSQNTYTRNKGAIDNIFVIRSQDFEKGQDIYINKLATGDIVNINPVFCDGHDTTNVAYFAEGIDKFNGNVSGILLCNSGSQCIVQNGFANMPTNVTAHACEPKSGMVVIDGGGSYDDMISVDFNGDGAKDVLFRAYNNIISTVWGSLNNDLPARIELNDTKHVFEVVNASTDYRMSLSNFAGNGVGAVLGSDSYVGNALIAGSKDYYAGLNSININDTNHFIIENEKSTTISFDLAGSITLSGCDAPMICNSDSAGTSYTCYIIYCNS